jgi:hypothetical protein
MRSWTWTIILVLAVIALPVWTAALSESFRHCVQSSGDDLGPNLFTAIYHLLRMGTVCAGRLANSNQGAASAVAGGIGIIVAIAVFLVYHRQANIMDRQADIAERQENLQRAWVIAGMGYNHHFRTDADTNARWIGPNGGPIAYCNPGFHNYGQTPAFVSYLDWAFCPDPPPTEPKWFACTRTKINDWVGTSQEQKPVQEQPIYEMTKDTVIFYGRLVYIDVLKREHYSGFIYRWKIDGTHERLGGDYPKYVEWT